jgi:hypothetical protein
MCNARCSMKVIRCRLIPSLCCILTVGAEGVACSRVPPDQRSLVRADAEAFESVVRSEMIDSIKESFAFLRVDSRPAGDNTILTGTAERPRALDLEKPADSISPNSLARITKQRKDILSFLRVEEGEPVRYAGCGGTHTERLEDSSAILELPGCPKALRRYVNVGLPYRGAAPILARFRRSEIAAPDSTDEHWTVLVTESSVGPGGENWRQYAWLFRRDRETNRLLVAEKYLLSWAE